ncbi:branched-chain amino acid ABC transporter permease [Candidatus Acetothermia bacterium]|nr:branched-chain amino acid ABC transporter permease [Candidatus Acetothermia bacterium]
MTALLDVLVFGFLISSLYALAAVGFTMIFGVAGVLNLSHGAFVMLGAYIAIWAQALNDPTIHLPQLGLNLPAAFLLAILGVAVIAPLIYRVFVRPVQDRPIIVFLVTLLLAILFEQVAILIFSVNPRALPAMVGSSFSILGTQIEYNRLLASVIALVAIGALWLFVHRTKTGKAILALSMDRKGAALVGINAERIQLIVWAVSGALAAIAGLFMASFMGMSPLEERVPLVISFSIVVLGGLGSIPGSLWAAYIIGYAETIVAQFAPEARGLAALIFLFIILALRPQGLLGRKVAH